MAAGRPEEVRRRGVPAVAPRTVASAARAAAAGGTPATLALVSVPGPYAFAEAMDALQAGLHVMVFSDNVPIEQEVRLKDEGRRRGLLVMGPDCGTAVVGGVGLGFANVLRPGPVGVVAASGTGAQQLTCLLDAAGVGVRHCLGVGGRDLSAAVGGRSTRQALVMLDADPAVELIVVVSKPPAPEVAAELEALAGTLSTPVQLALLGPGRPDLTAAAESAARACGAGWPPPRRWPAPQHGVGPPDGRYPLLRGAFSGGTLCDEAMLIAAAGLGPIASNIPLDGAPRLGSGDILAPGGRADGGHAMVDFGDDELTRGRPHPMIDPSLRVDWLLAQAARPAVLLLDVVLGHGAHPDPASDLAPAIEQVHRIAADAGHTEAVVVSLCGTAGDPAGPGPAGGEAGRGGRVGVPVQRRGRPGGGRAAGRWGEARISGGGAVTGGTGQPPADLLAGEPRVITAGVSLFADALAAQAVEANAVDWRPPADPDPDGSLAAALARVIADPRRPEADRTAVQRMLASRALLVDVRPASEALDLDAGTFLHAGPPLDWERASGPMRGALQGAMVFEGLADTPEEAERALAGSAGPRGPAARSCSTPATTTAPSARWPG